MGASPQPKKQLSTTEKEKILESRRQDEEKNLKKEELQKRNEGKSPENGKEEGKETSDSKDKLAQCV